MSTNLSTWNYINKRQENEKIIPLEASFVTVVGTKRLVEIHIQILGFNLPTLNTR